MSTVKIEGNAGGSGTFTIASPNSNNTRTLTLPDEAGTILASGGALGTPSSATLTNATGLPIATGVSGLGTGVATFLATPSSANLAAAVTNETGTGALVFATSPTFVTPVLGVATATSLQGIIGNVTPAAGSFTTLGASSTATLNTLSSSGATLTGGTINGMTVGAAAAAGGAFTTLTASTNLSSTRINPRTSTVADTATLTPNISTHDQFNITAQAQALTVAAPIGTPVDGNKLILRILDNGTSRALTFNATYTVIGTTLPTATTINKMLYVGCIFNSTNARWDVVGVTTQV